jgi:large subunit ribosomal protein L10
MLTRPEKEALVDGIKADITKARALFLTNLIGVKSNDGVAIRKSIRDAGGKVVITRNTLFERAGKGTVAEKLLTGLKGPQALAFAFDDAAAVAKCLKDAGKDHELVELRGGFLNGEELTQAQVTELASLPSRDEMLGTLLATFNAPLSALARVLFAIGEQKDGGGEAVAAAPEGEPAPAE